MPQPFADFALIGDAMGMPRRRPVPVDPDRRRPRKDPVVERLTRAILDEERAGNRAGAKARVAVGGMLRNVHARLDHGEWLAWLEHEVPYGARTAQRAIALHTWAQANPRQYKRLAHLGPSKLTLLSSVKPKTLKRLMGAERILVPGTHTRAPLDRLSFKQLLRVVKLPTTPLVEELETRRAIERVTRGIRRIAKTTSALDVAAVPRETAVNWHADLLRAADALAGRFDLA